MDDLISRQAEIDMLKEVASCLVDEDQPFMNTLIENTKRLPSVQPEPQWIPCEERLPELWSEVLTTWIVNGEYKITRAELRPHGWFALVFPDDGRYKQDGCIAWMLLPEPYREEGE